MTSFVAMNDILEDLSIPISLLASLTTVKMVNCAVVGCANRVDRDSKSFFRLPKVIKKQYAETLELSEKHLTKWLANISREIKERNQPRYVGGQGYWK